MIKLISRMKLITIRFFCSGENPASTGVCSSRGLAKVAAAMANRGQFGGTRVLSEKAWEMMHGDPHKEIDNALKDPGLSPTEFTRGGVNAYK